MAPDDEFFKGLRDFADAESESLDRLGSLLDELRREDRARTGTLDTARLWERLEAQLGWTDAHGPPDDPAT